MSVIDQLRRQIGSIDRQAVVSKKGEAADGEEENVLSLAFAPADDALGGGLKRGALHEIAPEKPVHLGAATGFAIAVAGRTLREMHGDIAPMVWIQQHYAMSESGRLYGAGLQPLGLEPDTLLAVRVPKPIDVLWAMEEALSLGIKLVIGEIPGEGKEATITATRRLSLAAKAGGGIGLLLRHRASTSPSAALTRWHIAAINSHADRFGGLGLPAFSLSLVKNRHGSCGRWIAHWNYHEQEFLASVQSPDISSRTLPRGLFPVPRHGPDRARQSAAEWNEAGSPRRHRIAS